MGSYLFDNFILLVDLARKPQKKILQELNISTSAPWHWKTRGRASAVNLKKLAKYFSNQLDIPYKIFKDGNALITDDLEPIVKHLQQSRKNETLADNLHKTDIEPGSTPISGITNNEKRLVFTLREFEKGSRHIPLGENDEL